MKILKKNWHKLVLLSYVLFVPVISFAHVVGPGPVDPNAGKLVNPIPYNSIPDFIQKILEGLLRIGIPIVALAIVYCGFLFVKARGKPEEIKEAKGALMYTLIGAAILLGSWALAKMISATVLAL